MLTCAALAFYLLLANAPFFAGSLVILYVSAITVLFVYVVLMLPTRKVSFATSFNFFLYLNLILFLCLLLLPTLNDFSSFILGKPVVIPLDELGLYLFTDGSFNFILLTIIFFVTLIGLFLLQ
jgi:NADH:ubiquinone oxidoreductase subunit 6 (subunit J)